MRSNRSRLAVLGVAALALGVFAVPGAAQAKKLKPFEEQLTVGAAIPPSPGANTASTPLISTIGVPKKYKGRKVADVNVTGISTSGSAAGASGDLKAKLTAPNGRTVLLFDSVGQAGQPSANLGPWTLDDDTFLSICMEMAPCDDPTEQLNSPYAGTSNLINNDDNGHGPGAGPLSNFDGVNMRGEWTLRIWDEADATTSAFNSWGLQIKPLKLKPPTVEVE